MTKSGLNMAQAEELLLDPMTRQRIEALARAQHRSASAVLETAARDYLDRQENALAETAEDEARWQRYQRSGHAIAQESVIEWLDALAEGQRKPCPK